MDAALLQVRNLVKRFSGVVAVDDVSLQVGPGQLVGVLGANGAGKSTLFHLIAGHLWADSGSVVLAGHDMTQKLPYRRAALGLGLVFQSPRLFNHMTVLENVKAGQHLHGSAGMAASALRLPRHRRDEQAADSASRFQLETLGLSAYEYREVGTLPFGIQRRVALAQALGVADRILLLDEPAAGLTGGERDDLRTSIGKLRDRGLAILLIEHDVKFVASIADALCVLDRGSVIAAGGVSEVLSDPAVMAAYSGVST